MNKKLKWFLVVAWMIVIFWFSNQPAVVSDEKSRFVIHFLNILGLNLDSILGELANFVVRKISHFTEYFILYIFLFNALKENFNVKKAIILGILILFLYACSDEIHQFFIPGRSCRFMDVLIDTSGGIFASVILYLNNNKK